MTRARWEEAFADRARAYWTPERTRALVGDKDLPITPGEAAPLLRAIGLLDGDAAMSPSHVRKYRQVNHMVILLASAIAELGARHAPLCLLDAGCGRSYLSLLVAWCALHRWGLSIEVLGVDRNPAVIEECRRRAELAEVDRAIRFEAGALDHLDVGAAWARAFGGEPPAQVHGVMALHACDTATCDALALGVSLGADLIAAAPCCQAELSRRWSALAAREAPGGLAPIWRSPHLRRETAAHVTDAMRTLLLAAAGYQVSALEFVPAEHTKKNTLLRAVRIAETEAAARARSAALAEYRALREATGGEGLALEARVLTDP